MVSSWNLFVFLFLFFLSFTATVAGKDSHHSHHEHHAPSSDSPSSVDGHLAKRICIDPNPDDPICSPSRSGIGVASGGGEGHIVVGLVDCFGQPNGKAVVDRCGVCGGNGTTCLDCLGVPRGTHRYDACGVCGGNSRMCVDCKGVSGGSARYDFCGVCGGDNSTCCGKLGRPCCVNYAGVPDAYWDFILLPVTLDNLIEKFLFTRSIFAWLAEHLPQYSVIEDQINDLHIGRMAEFNRIFLDECLEPFCESSTTLYTQLVKDNSQSPFDLYDVRGSDFPAGA